MDLYAARTWYVPLCTHLSCSELAFIASVLGLFLALAPFP